MAAYDITLNFSKIFIAEMFVNSFELSNIIAKHFVPYALVFGLIFNLTFLFVVVRLERMRTIPNLYLSLQAIADCLYLLVQTGPTMWRLVNLHKAGSDNRGNWYKLLATVHTIRVALWMFHQPICIQFLLPRINLRCYSDRYLAIVHPIRYQQIRSRKHTIKIITGILGWALLFSSTDSILKSDYKTRCFEWPTIPPYNSFNRISTCFDQCPLCRGNGIYYCVLWRDYINARRKKCSV